MSLTTLLLLRQTLITQQLSVGQPNFAEVAQSAAEALRELDEAIKTAQS